ncbi:MAG: hypothetical protein COV79_00800, partial [Parcubacteria group bacterium CG11_big_fil_rev_8_21_14_0_20_41_14]
MYLIKSRALRPFFVQTLDIFYFFDIIANCSWHSAISIKKHFSLHKRRAKMRTIFVFIIAAFMFLGCGDSSKKSSLGPQELVIYSSEWDLSKIVPIDSVRALPAGTIMFVRTAFDANGMRD